METKKDPRQNEEIRKSYAFSLIPIETIAIMDKEVANISSQQRCQQCIHSCRLKSQKLGCIYNLNFDVEPPEPIEGECFYYCKKSDEIFSVIHDQLMTTMLNLPKGNVVQLWDQAGSQIAQVVFFFCRTDITTICHISELNFYIEHDIADNRCPPAIFRMVNAHSVLTRKSYYDDVWGDKQNCFEAKMLKIYAQLLGEMMSRPNN